MVAREMFKKLGYTNHVYDNHIVYERGNNVMRDAK